MRRITALAALAALLAVAPPALAQQDPGCIGETEAEGVPQKPGPALRVGVTPGVQTGQLGTGPSPPRTPEDPVRHLAALDRLRPAGAPFVLRLHRFFWSDGEEGVRRFLALAHRYTDRGYLVELQLRYHPDERQEGAIAAWTAHVRDVVRRFGANPRVVAIQVTNEVNLTFSPDSSDGAYDRARDALVEGVVAAQDEKRRRGFGQLEIGFNWAYRTDPASEQSFWNGVRDKGGKRFADAVDWVGLDAYPGTFFPPAEAPGEERDGMVNAMSSLRCYLKTPGIPETVPIHIEENGWPTSPSRPEEQQAVVAETLFRAVHDFRGTYNVSDYRWFNLRDGDSTSPNYQVRYGILRDDYTEKPAFGVLQRLWAQHARREGDEEARVPRGPRDPSRVSVPARAPSMHVHCRRGRLRAHVVEGSSRLSKVTFRAGRVSVTDRRRPFAVTFRRTRARSVTAIVADRRVRARCSRRR
jgi:hypothetical protein